MTIRLIRIISRFKRFVDEKERIFPSAFEGETQHEGAGGEVVEGTDIDVGVCDFEVDEAEGHLEFDGEFHVGKEDVEADSQGVAEVVRLKAYDALVGEVFVLPQRGEVEAIADTGGEVGAEVVVAHGAEFDLDGEVAVDGLDVAAGLGEVVGGEVGGLPGVGDFAGDEGDAGEDAEVEPVVEAQVADDRDMEAGGEVGGSVLQGFAQLVVLREFEVELGVGEAHLDAIVQQAGVELAEIADLGGTMESKN